MSSIPVCVKWQGQRFNLEVQVLEPVLVLKSQLYSLTGVPCEKQKILGLGKTQLKDDTILETLNIKPHSTLLLIGTAEATSIQTCPQVLEAPLEQKETSMAILETSLGDSSETLVKNSSDMSLMPSIPSGLKNLGNTCYMNATLQMLRSIPELRYELEKIMQDKTRTLDKSGTIIESLADVFQNMNISTSFSPLLFLSCLRVVFPQFAERDRVHGGFSQQDAEECWSQLIQYLRTYMPTYDNSPSFVDKYMMGSCINEMKCNESQDEPSIISKEDFIKLNCHIGMSTNYMIDGLRDGLKEIISKHSEVLNREATFTKTSKLSRLPKYLTVNFVRFFWKMSIRKKVKILRKVKFPFELDISELCVDELRSKLLPVRDILRNINKILEEKNARKKIKTLEKDNDDDKSLNEMIKELWKLVDLKSINEGSNVSGLYKLVGILTHSGVSADAGHYQAWIKIPDSSDWYQFNDDDVKIVPQSKIETLDGGGENDMAYIALYSSMTLPNNV